MSEVSPYLRGAIVSLWLIWGAVHVLAGFIVISADAAGGMAAIGDAVDPAATAGEYHPVLGAILNQHGWNLFCAGAATIIGGLFVWFGSQSALWLTALVGGLFDLGYFMFIDLGGFANFIPGTLMTLVSGAAVLITAYAYAVTPRSTLAG
ncbi:MAG: hypothetical protein AAFP17_03050 [Pseudomonadota bacterium]